MQLTKQHAATQKEADAAAATRRQNVDKLREAKAEYDSVVRSISAAPGVGRRTRVVGGAAKRRAWRHHWSMVEEHSRMRKACHHRHRHHLKHCRHRRHRRRR